MKIFVTVGCCFAALLCSADTLVTLDGKKYVDYQISSLRHNGVSIIHSTGGTVIPWDKLPIEKISFRKVPVKFQKQYIDKIAEIKEKADALKREAAALKKRQEREAAVQKERQKLFNEIKEIRSLCGYRLGEKLWQEDIDKKCFKNTFYVKKKAFLSGIVTEDDFSSVSVSVNNDGIIYEISAIFLKPQDDFYKWLSSISPNKTEREIEKKIKKDNREMRVLRIGSSYVTITDLQLKPPKDEIFGAIEIEKNKMQKLTWYSSDVPSIEIKNNFGEEKSFNIYAYIGEYNDGVLVYRMYTCYYGKDWIFYNKVQIMDQNGREIFIAPGAKKKSDVSEYGVLESSDNSVNEYDFMKIKNAKTLRVRFYGKYDQEFDLPKSHVDQINRMIRAYEFMKKNKTHRPVY